ncbi:MAG: GumC family protein [Pirellulaceae bacterium]
MSTDASGLLDLFDLSLLWRRKWSVLLSVLVAVGLSAAYMQQQTPIYEVSTRVLVQLVRFGTDQERLVRTAPSFLATQGEILRSPVVVQPALETLQDSPAVEPDFEVINTVMQTLRVSPVDDANVLKLTYRSDDPEYAVRLLHAIVDTYRDCSKEMQQGGFAESLQILAQRDAELRAELEQAEEKYYTLRKESPLIGQGKEAFGAHMAMLEQVGRRLTEARSQRIDKETQMQSMLLARGSRESTISMTPSARQRTPNELPNDSSPKETNGGTTFVTLEAGNGKSPVGNLDVAAAFTDPSRIQEELWRAEIRATETSQIYGPKFPEMRALQEQIAMWRQRLEAYEEAAPAIVNQELDALRKNETYLTEIYDAEFQKVKLLDSSMLKEQHALADIQRVQDIHDLTATQLRELEFADEALANGQITTMVRMLEAPDATATLVWPRTWQFISLCAALGFAAGCVLVTFAERVTRRR